MDHSRFDRLTRTMAHILDRRRAVAVGLGLATAGSVLATGDDVAARPAICRASGRYCTHNHQCCNERCRTGKKYPKATRNVCECLAPNGWCGATCTKLMEDERNCGNCGRRCKSNETCCDGGCVRLGDSSNCLACGDVCGPDETCCGATGGCADMRANNSNCGACGEACVDANCIAGVCVPICGIPGEACDTDDECCPGAVCGEASTCCSELGGRCAIDTDSCSDEYVCQNSVVCVPEAGDCASSSECCGSMTCDEEESTCVPACSAYVGDACPSGEDWQCCVGDCFPNTQICCANPLDPCTQASDVCDSANQICGTSFDGTQNVVCVKALGQSGSNAECCSGLIHLGAVDTFSKCVAQPSPALPTNAWLLGGWANGSGSLLYSCSLTLGTPNSCQDSIQCTSGQHCIYAGHQWNGSAWTNSITSAQAGFCHAAVAPAPTTCP